jgi:amino acid adenylation domain-containing protein
MQSDCNPGNSRLQTLSPGFSPQTYPQTYLLPLPLSERVGGAGPGRAFPRDGPAFGIPQPPAVYPPLRRGNIASNRGMIGRAMPDGAAPSAAQPEVHRPAAHAWWRATATPPGDHGPANPARTGLGQDVPHPAEADPGQSLLDRPLFAAFAEVARRQPEAPAVQAGARSVRYGELLDRATSLAERVNAATVPGVAVATLLPDPVDAACGILACLAAGRPCISLNPDHPSARLADILADAGAGGLIVPLGSPPPALPCALPLIPLHASAQAVAAPTGTAGRPSPAAQDAPCLIIYTSGSTGRPKGIVRSQRQMLARAVHRAEQFRLSPLDRMLLLYPLSSGPGVTAFFAALLSGGAVHVANASAIGARAVLAAARGVGITTVSSVPALLRMLFALDGAGEAFGHLRSIYTSSESLLRPDVEAWRRVLPPGVAIRIGYGLTEGAPLADWFLPPDLPGTAARLPIGYPIPWHDLAITDADGVPVPDGRPGELWARGRLLSLGEWRHGRCEPGRLLADPDDPSGAILRTGDLVRRRPDGLLEFLGRTDQQIRIRGNRVEPAELEHALLQAPEVADAAVLVRRTVGDPVLVAFVVAAAGLEPAPRDAAIAPPGDARTAHPRDALAAHLRDLLIERLRATLPTYMLPARLHLVAAVPKLHGGKIDPRALERLDDASVMHRASGAPEAAVARGPFARLRRLVGLGPR